MLYELFMFWVVGSITVVVASMVLGGLLCVWCAYRGSKQARLSSTRRTPQTSDKLAPSSKF
jgi:uncharacterized membrane protein YqjE